MKFLRKLMLAICAVGMAGLLGYTIEASAAVKLEVKVDSDNYLSVAFPYEEVLDADDIPNPTRFGIGDGATIKIKIGGSEIVRGNEYLLPINQVEEDGEWDGNEGINLTDLIFDKIDNREVSASKFEGRVSVEIDKIAVERYYKNVDDYQEREESGSGTSDDPIMGIYKQTVDKKGDGRVRAYVTGVRSGSYSDDNGTPFSFYTVKGDLLELIAAPYSDDMAVKWSDGGDKEHSVVISGSNVYTAEFNKAATGISLKVNNKSDASVSIYNDGSITLAATVTPSGSAYKSIKYYPTNSDYFYRKSDTSWSAVKNTPSGSPVEVYAVLELLDGSTRTSNRIKVSIVDKVYSASDFSIKAEQDYITEGYSLNLLADFSRVGNIYEPIIWTVEGEGTLTGLSQVTGSGKTVKDYAGVMLTAKEGKLDIGKTGTIKVYATLPDGNGEGIPLTVDKSITVYSKNSIKYNDSDKNLSFTSPSKVNTGNTSGVDNDDKDTTKTTISEVKGIKIHVYSGDKFLGMTAVAKDKGTSGTIDSTTLGKIIGTISGSLSGDSADLKIRALPCDSDGKYNKKVYANTSMTVYRVVVTYTKADGTTAEFVTYRPEGSKLNVADAISEVVKSSDGKVTMVDGNSDTTVTVSSTASQNKHTAVLGASVAKSATAAGAAGGAGAANRDTNDPSLDKVPKTGQDNTVVFVMVAVVVCAVGGGLYAYNKKFKKA